MADRINEILLSMSSFIWGIPSLIFLIGTGVYLTFGLRFLQIRRLGYVLKLLYGSVVDKAEDEQGDISPFQALTTSLSATVGTGNIAGVASAIAVGGPGAIFWLWVAAIVGMATKYAEAVLAVKYRVIEPDGSMAGGPMYYLERGLNTKFLGILFAIFGAVASFGIGNMVQANSIADVLRAQMNIPPYFTGLVLTALALMVIIGGIKRIGNVTEKLVPAMAFFYITGSLIIILLNIDKVPAAFAEIFSQAFTGTAATGGFLGAGVMLAIRKGVSRGVFSNEAGLGSAPIAHAAARTKNPVKQGLIAMTGVFIDSIVVCSLTALVIVTTGVWRTGIRGAELSKIAFDTGLPGPGGLIIAFGLIFFGFSTILGWAYYGEKCAEYLFSTSIVKVFRWLYCFAIYLGSVVKLGLVWNFADVANGFMAVPNLIGLLGLSGVVFKTTREYFEELNRKAT